MPDPAAADPPDTMEPVDPGLLRDDLAALYPQFGVRVAHAGLVLAGPTDVELLELAAIVAEPGGIVEPGREPELLAWPPTHRGRRRAALPRALVAAARGPDAGALADAAGRAGGRARPGPGGAGPRARRPRRDGAHVLVAGARRAGPGARAPGPAAPARARVRPPRRGAGGDRGRREQHGLAAGQCPLRVPRDPSCERRARGRRGARRRDARRVATPPPRGRRRRRGGSLPRRDQPQR